MEPKGKAKNCISLLPQISTPTFGEAEELIVDTASVNKTSEYALISWPELFAELLFKKEFWFMYISDIALPTSTQIAPPPQFLIAPNDLLFTK